MKAILSALAVEIVFFGGAAIAQPDPPLSGATNLMCQLSGNGDIVCHGSEAVKPTPALPVETTKFVCKWGANPNQHFVIKNGSLVMTQTGDVWTILQNNPIGIVATSSMAQPFSGKALMRDNVGFFSIAIDRRTGLAVKGTGTAVVTTAVKGDDEEYPALSSYTSRGTCSPEA